MCPRSFFKLFLLFSGIIVIQYQFSSGIQGRDHPNPGEFNMNKKKDKKMEMQMHMNVKDKREIDIITTCIYFF